MSSVEQGLGGVWSCLYCEGTWLTAKQVQALASTAGAEFSNLLQAIPAVQDAVTEGSLACPGCEERSLQTVSLGEVQAHCLAWQSRTNRDRE